MRLTAVRKGKGLSKKLFFTMIRVVSGMPAPDVIKTLHYRPEFFGRPFSAWVQRALRGPSAWSVGERELMAAFVSRQNQCPF